jgi:hypothetical protein
VCLPRNQHGSHQLNPLSSRLVFHRYNRHHSLLESPLYNPPVNLVPSRQTSRRHILPANPALSHRDSLLQGRAFSLVDGLLGSHHPNRRISQP